MESLAIAYAYEAYETEQGIEYELPEFFAFKRLPNGGWLAYLGILILSSQLLLFSPAIARTPTYDNPVSGAIVNVSKGCLNARHVPSKAGDSYDCLKRGETLKAIVKEENGWYQLSSGGWISKKYVLLPDQKTATKSTTPPQKNTTSVPHPKNKLIGKLFNRKIYNWAYDPQAPLQGEEIKTLQKHLNWYALLATPIDVTGIYDLPTKLAVEMFQKKRSLPVDGITGSETRTLLKMES